MESRREETITELIQLLEVTSENKGSAPTGYFKEKFG